MPAQTNPDGLNWKPFETYKETRPKMTQQDYCQMICVWAGQLGHEKCGLCLACKNPRSMRVDTCKHPLDQLWRAKS